MLTAVITITTKTSELLTVKRSLFTAHLLFQLLTSELVCQINIFLIFFYFFEGCVCSGKTGR